MLQNAVFCDDIQKKPSASGGVASRPLSGALPLNPTGGLLRPPDPRIIFLLFHFSPVPCLQLAVERQQQRRKCPLIGHTNNRPSLLSIIEDLAKFGHSYSSIADRCLQSSAMQSRIGAYGLVLRCRRSVPSVLKGLMWVGLWFLGSLMWVVLFLVA